MQKNKPLSKKSISPTPTIGAVGLIKNLDKVMSNDFKEINSNIFVIGKTLGHLHQSEFFREVIKFNEGPSPEINLFNEKNNGLAIQKLISKKLINSVHDISSGGILVSLAEMCTQSEIGAKIKIPRLKIAPNEYLFAEDQSRYLVEVSENDIKEVTKILENNSVYFEIIGKTQKEDLVVENLFSVKVSKLLDSRSFWFKSYFGDK